MKNITNANGDTYYNTSSFPYYNVRHWPKNGFLNSKTNTAIKIRLLMLLARICLISFIPG